MSEKGPAQHRLTTKKSAASYPLQVKIIRQYLVVLSPEWKIQVSAGALSGFSTSEKMVSAASIGNAVLKVYSEVQRLIDEHQKKGQVLPQTQPFHFGLEGHSFQEAFLSIGEAAGLLGVSQGTVRRLVSMGYLTTQNTPGGHRRFSSVELHAFLQARENYKGNIPGYRAIKSNPRRTGNKSE